MDNFENDNIKNEVLEHFRNYKNNIIRNKDSNNVIRTVELGQQVLNSKDFDINMNSRRETFEEFYEDSIYTFNRFLPNNMVELKYNKNSELKSVYKSVIKKI